ncbi:MAG: hypothetical protein IT563_07955 [Alphaproteobacteria bacterium]|nr:hypothetical protein [Alphaproteobacteria bacterium]
MNTIASPFSPNRVSWSGENPGIYLRESAEGKFTALASFFRVVLSPHGPGKAVVVCAAPDKAAGADAGNFVLSDNDKLARWLVSDFLSHFGAFKDKPAVKSLAYLKLDKAETRGDVRSSWVESISGGGHKVEMSWSELGEPVCVDVPPAQSATGRHQMYSLFINAGAASLVVDNKKMPGGVFARPFFGRDTGRTAFLAFSETWLNPA